MTPPPLHRRDVLAAAGTTAAAWALSARPAPAAEPPAPNRPVCIFSKHLQDFAYEEMAEVAAEVGFDGVDLAVRPRGHVEPARVSRDLPRAVAAVQRAGLSVPMMVTAVRAADEPLTRRVLATARDQGIRTYRLGYLSYDERVPILETLRQHHATLRALADLNGEIGIHGAYQNHAGTRFGGPVWDVQRALEGLDPRWIGCQYDIRHAVVEGATSWPLGLRLLAPHIHCSVIKDFYWGQRDGRWRVINCPVGEGMVDFAAYLRQVKSLGLTGPISVHFEYPLYDQQDPPSLRRRRIVTAMKHDLQTLRGLLRSADLT